MPDDGRVCYARRGETWVLRFEGAIRYTGAHAVESFLDALFNREKPQAILVDLNAVTSIDSTGIGLLARIANGLNLAGKDKPVFFSTNAEITELLTSMCLDAVATITTGTPDAAANETIPATLPDARELARTIRDAHRLLCELSEENRTNFRDVVAALTQEIGEG